MSSDQTSAILSPHFYTAVKKEAEKQMIFFISPKILTVHISHLLGVLRAGVFGFAVFFLNIRAQVTKLATFIMSEHCHAFCMSFNSLTFAPICQFPLQIRAVENSGTFLLCKVLPLPPSLPLLSVPGKIVACSGFPAASVLLHTHACDTLIVAVR